ncbi:MAG: hypothetical protein DRI56_04340 [Chloroflexota bacterium]|nr:MAG: hypothetical protein DRI56_04340 [Chloroflexota bacterium]
MYTDDWAGKPTIIYCAPHAIVCHSDGKWVRGDDGDGIREVHTNSIEGMWIDVHNFLRLFKGIHSGYVAMLEFCRNLKCVLPGFISSIIKMHTFT